MTGMIGPPGFAGDWNGGQITTQATCVLAPNAGPQTLDGTNTWLIGAPDSRTVTVIDQGPTTSLTGTPLQPWRNSEGDDRADPADARTP